MCHKPCGLIGDAQHTVQLVAGHALFGRAEQVYGLKPYVELDLGTLKDGADCHAELLTTVFALPQSRTMRLAFKGVMVAAYRSAVRAYRAIGPAHGFKVFASGVGVLKMRLIQMRMHDVLR